MPAHNVFTEIDAKSYAAIVKNGWLSEVILALLVDPLEAADVAESIKSRSETAIKLEVNGRSFLAPISLEDFQSLPSKDAFEKLKITLSQWVMTTDRADTAVKTLTMWDRRFGVWCACVVVREVLRFTPKGEVRPLRAIETVELWVRGMATPEQVNDAAAAVAANAAAAYFDADAYSVAAEAACAAARDAAYAAAYYAITDDTADAADAANAADAAVVNAVANAAYADVTNGGVYLERLYEVEMIRLREVVARACLTFPG